MIDRLNVVYIHSHDTGRCMEPYGYPVPMPAYRRIASEGLVFRQAFSAAPTCSPSRAALLTGQAPHSAGMLGLAHRGFSLRDPHEHLAAYLGSHGFHTVLAGHQHLTIADPGLLGYETVLETSGVPGEEVAAHAAAFLTAASAERRPFFLDVGFSETHRPFRNRQGDEERFVGVLAGLPDTPEIRADIADFHTSLRALDRVVGEVIDALDASGLAEQTLVIVTTDHGPPFPGYKATLTDRGLGVGLILRQPRKIAPGQVSDTMVSQIDLFSTICALSNLPIPVWNQGRSLLPLLEGTQTRARTEVFGEVTFHAAYEPQRAIRTDRWTYIRRFGDYPHPVMANIDASPALEWLIEHGWPEQVVPTSMLFDNALDPLQRTNLSGVHNVAGIEQDLASRLLAWMAATADPLLAGQVELPDGAAVNRVTAHSPDEPLVSDDFRSRAVRHPIE